MYAQVVNETLRLMNIPPGLLRKALKDINVKGMYAYALIAMNPPFVINYIYSLMELIDRFTFTFPGYTIPAGWTIMLVTPIVHLNPETYKDPLKFNPWRWKVCFFICHGNLGDEY
jgi:hypothetical protein